MKDFCKVRIVGIFYLFGLLFHPGLTYCIVSERVYSIAELKSDSSGMVTVSGMVVDEKGAVIPNVGVTIAGTYRNMRITPTNGTFEIKVPSNQKFYLNFKHINFLIKSIPINSESDISGLKVELKELVCHLDLIKDIVSCPTEDCKSDLAYPIFKDTPKELMMIDIDLSKPQMAGGEDNWFPRFHRKKSAVLYELGILGNEIYGKYQGTFCVDTDGVVRKVTVEGVQNSKVADVLEDIFQKTGKWGPAKNYGSPVVSHFTFSVEFP